MRGDSGQSGPLGRIADRWDSIPVKGPMAAAVVVLGLLLTASHPGPDNCQSDPLRHVYKPSRLLIKEKCAHVTGTVMAWRHEHDDDYHVSMVMDETDWTNPLNVSRQHGYTVVEFVPGDPRPKFHVGQRLELTGTKVLDLQHGDHKTTGWIELHTVFKYRDVSASVPPRPNHPQLAPASEEPEHEQDR